MLPRFINPTRPCWLLFCPRREQITRFIHSLIVAVVHENKWTSLTTINSDKKCSKRFDYVGAKRKARVQTCRCTVSVAWRIFQCKLKRHKRTTVPGYALQRGQRLFVAMGTANVWVTSHPHGMQQRINSWFPNLHKPTEKWTADLTTARLLTGALLLIICRSKAYVAAPVWWWWRRTADVRAFKSLPTTLAPYNSAGRSEWTLMRYEFKSAKTRLGYQTPVKILGICIISRHLERRQSLCITMMSLVSDQV